ncbi:hypothetical protein PC129_g4732 [Phytophthora cactorum]|uniref:Uncharacterized protein n=2 Tax=Phytophthora cactorum TaxID=29920 RepID=A0A329SFQ7_9STRA|nr:hypothetical protein Pcac1_g99 [Phytophthora cactorum]KAG2835111.1 hypothetical protein PC111_g5544 [Phytophthora cactorum]KAG2842772.1 hypothetical protein PC112_g2895 [Phytophthora cactorum]KAG2862407.1 hypothetical protein PC113_g6337 [Phytophthora cactorum]KAG2919195.1 hypothetical protein PC114_g6534 [Phytophthora cactorum]
MSCSSSLKPQPMPRRIVRRPLQFASPAKEQQYRAEMDHVQQYICEQVGGLDEASSQLLGVHDSRSRSHYEEIQEFLERKHQLEQHHQPQQTVQPTTERVLIRSLDEYLNELDPSLFIEYAPVTPKRLAVANLPAHSSYIRRKQEEAMLTRLWTKYQAAEVERCAVPSMPCGGPLKRQRVM